MKKWIVGIFALTSVSASALEAYRVKDVTISTTNIDLIGISETCIDLSVKAAVKATEVEKEVGKLSAVEVSECYRGTDGKGRETLNVDLKAKYEFNWNKAAIKN